MVTGKLLRFDDVRGYGFIAPDDGGEDVFVHANDLRDEKYLYRAGTRVAFAVEDGDRGLKASDVRITEQPPAEGDQPPRTGRATTRDDDEDVLCDVLSFEDFQQELTESLLDSVPSLTGGQLLQVRKRVMQLVQTHNWVEP